jgi:archaellum component FlaC
MAPGEIARWLERLDKGQQDLLAKFEDVRSGLVSRGEWEMSNRMHTQDVADLENQVRDLTVQVATHRDGISRIKGVMWILGGLLGVVVTIITSYIQSGRL